MDETGEIMTKDERKAAIESIKEICQEIGCSGMEPDMCQNRPTQCSIIRKIFLAYDKSHDPFELHANKEGL